MDLGKGPRQPSVVVKKENERAGSLSRTKYFIRIGEGNMMPEIKEPLNLPDGGFIVPMQVDIGSSDFMRPQMPSPGDIRRMFGNDKIDCEPEYARGMDPDWSRVSPTTPAELEYKIREWDANTNAVLRKYRDLEEKRSQYRQYGEKPMLCKITKRTRSEGNGKKNSKSVEIRNKSAGNKQSKNINSKLVGNGPREKNLTLPCTDNRKPCTLKPAHDYLSNDGTIVKSGPECRIPYSPERINAKSYTTGINVVQKMTSDHWIMIGQLYNDIKREKGINLDQLNRQVMKIVKEIYGTESDFVLSTIHPDPEQRIIRLGKLMLNVHHEAMFGEKKKQKLLVPGINNRHFAQKCLQSYTFTPQYRTTLASRAYQRLTASREKTPRCYACYKKKEEMEKSLQKKIGSQIKNPNKTINNKSNRKLPTSKGKPARQGNTNFNGIRKSNDIPKSKMLLYIPPFLAKELYENSPNNPRYDHSNESTVTFSSNEQKSLEKIEWKKKDDIDINDDIDTEAQEGTSVENIEEMKTDDDQDTKSSNENIGGGDTLEQYGNDYNFWLSSLYESDSNISLELSKKLSASLLMASFGTLPENQNTECFFTSTANILQLNDQLEKMLKESQANSSRSVPEVTSETDDENYMDCDSSEELASNILLKNNEIQKQNYKYSKWSGISEECINHRGYITFFMTLMLGLTSAFFCRDSFLNKKKRDPSLKDSVKQVIRTFLLGALHLVDNF